jgi:UrcA family protein
MRRSPLSLGVLGTLTILVATVALPTAADSRLVEESIEVRYSDLDLDKEAGVANLYVRLKNAAEQVCDIGYRPPALFLSSSWRACVTAALDEAVANVDRPALTAYHAARASSGGARGAARLVAARN